MSFTRRTVLKNGALATLGAGFWRRMDKIDGMQGSGAGHGGPLAEIVRTRGKGTSEKMLLGPTPGAEGPPEPAKFDRLSLEWNKQTVARFKAKLAEKGI